MVTWIQVPKKKKEKICFEFFNSFIRLELEYIVGSTYKIRSFTDISIDLRAGYGSGFESET